MKINCRRAVPLLLLLALPGTRDCQAQNFLNSGFESPLVSTGSFVVSPVGTGWLFQGSPTLKSGIANGNGPWGKGAAEEQQYAFIQGNASVSQTISNLVPGERYQLKFAMARRNGNSGADEVNRIEILQDTTSLNVIRAVDEVWRTYIPPVFTATSTSHTFHFRGLLESDKTTLLDAVRFGDIVPPTAMLENASFEIPAFAPGGWSYEANNLDGGGWYFQPFTGSGGAGIGSIGSPWGHSAVDGNQFAFVQRDGFMEQTLHNLTVGQYYFISFAAALRPGFGPHGLRVNVNGETLQAFTFNSTTWARRATFSFLATSPSMSLRFEGMDVDGDASVLLDDVRVEVGHPVATISGRITLQGGVNQEQPLTFEFRSTSGQPFFQRTTTLNANRTFSLPGVPRDTYNVWIKGARWLAKLVPVDAHDGDVTNVETTLLAGDSTNDNSVDVLDLDVLIRAFDSVPGDAHWIASTDFNCDDSVDVLDLDLMIRNFDKVGDP
jgi:hypothetical protein